MNCAEANQFDLVEYLSGLGYQPRKISRDDYWYLSPLREEKTASFKVNKTKNAWYDHGMGKGGKLVDFLIEFYHCDVVKALGKIALILPENKLQNPSARPPFQPLESNAFLAFPAGETAIKIIAAKQPIRDMALCRYLAKRQISKTIADKLCYEVSFTNGNDKRIFSAIGFKNNSGGFELRNEFFKASSSPKYISYIDHKSTSLNVFEGFFDYLSYETLMQKKELQLTNILVLNTLSFFQRSLFLMDKHENIHLYLDQDTAGKNCSSLALKR